eukprot:Rhum_TRINITY_DN14440_c12_g1::Rhum_TRINITY_DN14440_c12_g1_i1::g.90673::m.90673
MKGGSKKGSGGKGGKGSKGMEDLGEVQDLEPDTEILIIDPATKQKVPLLYKQTEPTTGRIAYIHNIGTKRDSYFCMLYQKGRCKSHSRCNQIHADRDVVAKLREEYFTVHDADAAKKPIEPHCHQRSLEIIVVDPTNLRSRLSLPTTKTRETEGRKKFLDAYEATGEIPDAKICPNFLTSYAVSCSEEKEKETEAEGDQDRVADKKSEEYWSTRVQCADGAACPFIHPDPSYVRFLCEPNKPCCTFHGVEHTVDYKGKVYMVNKNNQRCPLPLNRMMTTKGLKALVTSPSSLVFSCNRVCRLHQEKRCQWGRECSNLHVCREFYSTYASCCNPTTTSLLSIPGHQILANGKLKPIGKKAGANGPAKASVAVVGLPLSPGGEELYGIPLVTDEGSIRKDLLPEVARRRYPDAAAVMGTPMGASAEGAAPAKAQPAVVPEALQEVHEVDSEPEEAAPAGPVSPSYTVRQPSKRSRVADPEALTAPHLSAYDSMRLPITMSSASALAQQPSLYNTAAAGVPPPIMQHFSHNPTTNPFLQHTWSEFDSKRVGAAFGGMGMPGMPGSMTDQNFFGSQQVSELMGGQGAALGSAVHPDMRRGYQQPVHAAYGGPAVSG